MMLLKRATFIINAYGSFNSWCGRCHLTHENVTEQAVILSSVQFSLYSAHMTHSSQDFYSFAWVPVGSIPVGNFQLFEGYY